MRILVVDDEKNIRTSIAQFFGLEKIETKEAANGLSAQKLLQEERFDGAVVDLKMPGMDGLELLAWIRKEGPDIPVIMMSAFGEVQDAVTAMKEGAADYLVKPFDPEELVLRIRRAVNDAELARLTSPTAQPLAPTETHNPAMRRIYALIEKAAPSDSTVLITGESGTGKEVIANQIHARSGRRERAFVPINIGGVPENLLESELFGYERGAFTGAEHRKLGMFEMAQGGTLFLDEIGDMPLHLQVKLLRVLQERKIQRLGGTGIIPIDVRIIAATNRDLEDRVKAGGFREDLFYRLNVIRLELPPLRERSEDIPVLIGHFLKRMQEQTGSGVTAIAPEAVALLSRYEFPGNIRELENMIERAVILCDGDTLTERDFAVAAGRSDADAPPELPEGSLKELERQAIVRALHRHEGRRAQAAEELGITRRTLFNKIKEYNIEDYST